GLLPRLGREDRIFLPLPVIRPERSAINGETGLLRSLEGAFAGAGLKTSRAELRAAVEAGGPRPKAVLAAPAEQVMPTALEAEAKRKPPTIVIPIDQSEELFLAEGRPEAAPFLMLLSDLLTSDSPAAIAVFTIRSDNYERLQQSPELSGIHKS